MEKPPQEQSTTREPQVIDAIGFIVAEGFAVYCAAKILDLAQAQPPQWESTACGIGVLVLAASGAAANRWIMITRSRPTGLPRSPR